MTDEQLQTLETTLHKERAEALDLFGEYGDRLDQGRAAGLDRALFLLNLHRLCAPPKETS